MRTKLELWQVVKDNFDDYFKTGLCHVIDKLHIIKILEKKEYFSLIDEIWIYGNTNNYFLGKIGDPKPRLEFIEKMIKKHSEN